MADKAPTVEHADGRIVSGDVTNPRAIEWPHDQWGFTTILRKEGARAVGRIKGDPEKLAILLSTLRCLGQHANVKLADQQAEAEQTAAGAENRRQAEYARSKADQKAEVNRLARLLESAKAALAAKEAMPEGTE